MMDVFIILIMAAAWALLPNDGIALVTQWFYRKVMHVSKNKTFIQSNCSQLYTTHLACMGTRLYYIVQYELSAFCSKLSSSLLNSLDI